MGRHTEKEQRTPGEGRIVALAMVLAVLVGVLAFVVYRAATAEPYAPRETALAAPTAAVQTAAPTASPSPTPEPTPEPTPFDPHWVDSTDPSKLIASTQIQVDGETVDTYEDDSVVFGEGSEYTQVKGITTFRGNNFRDSAVYGTASITDKLFGSYWTVGTASLTAPDGAVWSGSGWTGQPLIVDWPQSTRKVMNLYDWAKQADDLVEVIYATEGGVIYFMELSTGKQTRDPINLGYAFKGAGSLDPRGYPILYVGAGYDSQNGKSRAFIISLIDGSVLYTFGNGDAFALRQWPMFDGAPLVDADTDRLIWPGENGVLYIITLGTQYDESAGTLSISPSKVVKWRYKSVRNTSVFSYWLGMEDSAVIWQGHLIIADNGGNLMCLDLHTLMLDWVQDTLDDTNDTPVLELEDRGGNPTCD